jgi:hypothetical protein
MNEDQRTPMKRLILAPIVSAIAITLGVLLLAPAARADQLPREILGKWCSEPVANVEPTPPGSEWTEFYSRWDKDCAEDAAIEIKQNEWTAWESGCRFTELKTRFDPTIPVATKTPPGVWVAHVKAKCAGEGCTWRSSFVLYLSKGTLFMRGRSSKEVCNG